MSVPQRPAAWTANEVLCNVPPEDLREVFGLRPAHLHRIVRTGTDRVTPRTRALLAEAEEYARQLRHARAAWQEWRDAQGATRGAA